MILVDGRKAWSAMHFTAPGTDRPICGILVEPHPEGGVIIVATDGVRLAAFRDETGQAVEPVILRLDPELMKRLRPGSVLGVRETDGCGMSFSGPPDEGAAKTHETQESVIWPGTFPQWRRLAGSRLPVGKNDLFVDFEKLATFRYLWGDRPTKRSQQRQFLVQSLESGYYLIRTEESDRFGILASLDGELPDNPFSWVHVPPALPRPEATISGDQEFETVEWMEPAGASWKLPEPRKLDDGN